MTITTDHNAGVSQTIPGPAQLLGAAGLLPLVLMAGLIWFSADDVTLSAITLGMIFYSALLLSFMGGARWGSALSFTKRPGMAAILSASLIPVLAGWLALLFDPLIAIPLLMSGFIAQGLWNHLSAQKGHLIAWYGVLSLFLSWTAILCLAVLLVRLLMHAINM